jgi:3-hydroxybutyrate dehydrogenase
VVTGSTSGIGLGIARALAAEGCSVMLNGFGDADEIARLRAGLEAEHGVGVGYSAADMSRPEQVVEMIGAAQSAVGPVDILVNNAGIQHVAPIEDFPVDRWDAVIAINLSSSFHSIRAALPGMKARGWGRIVNISSAHGLTASVQKSAYVAAKHGVIGLTKTVALETAEIGITCNAICPGWVRTPLVERQIEARAATDGITIAEAGVELVRERQPSKRFVEVDEIGALAVFLCGEGAASITGTALSIDGGWTAQ